MTSASASSSGGSTTSTSSRSQLSVQLHGRITSELPQEAQVVLVEEPDVVDAVLEHRDALDADAEGEAACTASGIVADGAEHRRDGSCPQPRISSQPVALQTRHGAVARAARAAADHAADVDLGARLGEREEARPEAHARVVAEHALHEQRASTPFRSPNVTPRRPGSPRPDGTSASASRRRRGDRRRPARSTRDRRLLRSP